MNINNHKLIIVSSAGLNDVGGPVTIVKWLSDNLQTSDYSFLVTELFHQKKFYRCKLVNILIKLRLFLKSLFKLFHVVSLGDIVLVNDTLGAGLPGLIVSLIKKNQLIVRLGGEIVWERFMEKNNSTIDLEKYFTEKMHEKNLLFHFNKFVLGFAKKIIVPSILLKNILVKYYKIFPDKIFAINNPVTNQIALPQPISDLNKTFIFVGRLVNLKNIVLLTESFIKADLGGWRLVIVGRGSCQQQLQGLADYNSQKIEIFGQLDKQSINDLFSQADCLLLPSISDVFPNVVMEALSVGLPVAISKHTGLPEEIKQSAYTFFDANDSESLINDLKTLTELETINSLKDKVSKIAWNNYDPKQIFNQYLKVIYE